MPLQCRGRNSDAHQRECEYATVPICIPALVADACGNGVMWDGGELRIVYYGDGHRIVGRGLCIAVDSIGRFRLLGHRVVK